MYLFSFAGNKIHPRSEDTAFTQQSDTTFTQQPDKHVFAIPACNMKGK